MVGMDQNPVQNDSSFTNTKVTLWKTNNEDKSNQCTMGKLQWGDGIRNFSLLREIMTI